MAIGTVFEDDDLSKHVNIDSCERDVRTPQSATVNTKSLDGISGALERLNQLGTAIRQSSVTNQIFKAREFAAEFDMTSFEQLANALVQKLFPDATNGLIELLTRSMAESYALFLHRKSRQKRLQITRHVPRSQKPLMRIPDETTGTPDGSAIMEVDLKALRVGDGLNNRIAQAPLSLPVHSVPESEPTSVDSKELHKRLRTLMSPTENTKPVSILVNQAEYPRPSKTSIICEWCFGPLTTDFRDDKPKWQ
ncbi:hypothetical protein N7478_005359 [Penicillium angulare]|uniref:uncharacterized protein n=1 Tax=Penicillium angulare TaxID=116970 RepID=UPI0025401057|nr:uncharacterized protein N7478_005359 [Penicillium angulare]KAJ5279987.1 hypothetical protein N7478_005359 [Penicillium angulare]